MPAHPEAAPDTGLSADYFMPPAIHRGDVARTVFYMATRYDGSAARSTALKVTDCPMDPSASYMMGRLSTLLEWHRLDPPGAREQYRNGAVCGFQGNRNPFVDFPELVDKIFGPGSGYVDPVANCRTIGSVSPTSSRAPTSAGGSNPSPTPAPVAPQPQAAPTPQPTPTPSPVTPQAAPTSQPTPTRAPVAPQAAPTSQPTPTRAPVAPLAAPTPVPVVPPLGAGDVAIVAVTVTSSYKGFDLVALSALPAGKSITVTDNGWTSAGFKSTEGAITLTLSSPVRAGTVLRWTAASPGAWSSTGSFVPSVSGDSLIAYTGPAVSPSMLFGLLYRGSWASSTATSDQLTSSDSALPSALTSAAVNLPSSSSTFLYTGSRSGSKAALLAQIASAANWQGSTAGSLPTAQAFSVSALAAGENEMVTAEQQAPELLGPVLGASLAGLVVVAVAVLVVRRRRLASQGGNKAEAQLQSFPEL